MSPRTREANEKIRSESMKKILMASMELFGSEGYQNVTISQIAKKAGVSQGLLYNYFKSKEELLEKIISRIFQEMEGFHLKDFIRYSPQEKLRIMINSFFEIFEKQKEFWLLTIPIITQKAISEKLRVQLAQWFTKFIEELVPIFHGLNYKSPRAEAYKLGATMDGIAFNGLFIFQESYPLQEVKEALLEQYHI